MKKKELKLILGFIFMTCISLVLLISMLYVFYWSLNYTNGEWFAVHLNSIEEFWFEFIALHIVFIVIIILSAFIIKDYI